MNTMGRIPPQLQESLGVKRIQSKHLFLAKHSLFFFSFAKLLRDLIVQQPHGVTKIVLPNVNSAYASNKESAHLTPHLSRVRSDATTLLHRYGT